MEEYSEKDKHDWYQRLKRHSFGKIFVVVCAFSAVVKRMYTFELHIALLPVV